uniref:Uncharacterized protein n=1 Tax=Arundo donax TaxID=35708 RepID=A0A0A9BKM3_ARUDO
MNDYLSIKLQMDAKLHTILEKSLSS